MSYGKSSTGRRCFDIGSYLPSPRRVASNQMAAAAQIATSPSQIANRTPGRIGCEPT
jgi:hypothetical protein